VRAQRHQIKRTPAGPINVGTHAAAQTPPPPPPYAVSSYLEPEGMEKTFKFTQQELKNHVDIATQRKVRRLSDSLRAVPHACGPRLTSPPSFHFSHRSLT
jgi:hypothetical protein